MDQEGDNGPVEGEDDLVIPLPYGPWNQEGVAGGGAEQAPEVIQQIQWE